MKIIIISQNVRLDSLGRLHKALGDVPVVVLSTQRLFEFERIIVEKYIRVQEYVTFAGMLTDKEMEWCDREAYQTDKSEKRTLNDVLSYYDRIKYIKNDLIAKHIIEKYGQISGYFCSKDLGIEEQVWKKRGLRYYELEYYHVVPSFERFIDSIKKNKPIACLMKPAIKIYRNIRKEQTDEIYVSYWKGEKYVFIGSLNKTGYRMEMEWKKSEDEYKRIKNGNFEVSGKCHYLSSLHEWTKCRVPDKPQFDVHYIQDGYLPPNYSSFYLKYVPGNVKYYAWDRVSLGIFKNQEIPAAIMPFRKKIYLPKPHFAGIIKKVLVVTSGAGDWTAIKNRSDEDLMVEAFAEIAKRFPDIEFVYRCHPVWIHPLHQGTNSIKRVVDYFEHTGLKNIRTSSNIIDQDLNDFKLSLPRQSLDDDLEGTDIVIGEHSIAMIDGALKGIPFSSLNLTGRRNLFCGISDLGFPHFETIDGIIDFIDRLPDDKDMQNQYISAIDRYNNMIDED